MRNARTKAELIRIAELNGLRVETNAPGDGMRRYWFFVGDRRLGYGLGLADADTWLDGYLAGRHEARSHAGG